MSGGVGGRSEVRHKFLFADLKVGQYTVKNWWVALFLGEAAR